MHTSQKLDTRQDASRAIADAVRADAAERRWFYVQAFTPDGGVLLRFQETEKADSPYHEIKVAPEQPATTGYYRAPGAWSQVRISSGYLHTRKQGKRKFTRVFQKLSGPGLNFPGIVKAIFDLVEASKVSKEIERELEERAKARTKSATLIARALQCREPEEDWEQMSPIDLEIPLDVPGLPPAAPAPEVFGRVVVERSGSVRIELPTLEAEEAFVVLETLRARARKG